jgi:hypothetical protein
LSIISGKHDIVKLLQELEIKSVDLGRGISITAKVSTRARTDQGKKVSVQRIVVESAEDDVADTATLS